MPEKSHGQRSLAGYSPWGCKGWDTAGQPGTHFTSTTTLAIVSPWSTSCLNLLLNCGCDSGNLLTVEFPFLRRHTQKAILFILTTVLSLDNSSSRLFSFLKISQVIKGSDYFGTSLSRPKPSSVSPPSEEEVGGTSLSRIARGRLRDPVTSGEMMPGARGGLSRVAVIPISTSWWRTLSARSGGLLGSHRSPAPCVFSGQCCNPGHKELGCGLLPSRPSWSQGISLMKATPGNFLGCGGSNHCPQGNCGDLMGLHRTIGPGVRELWLAPGSWSQLPRLHTAQVWCHLTSH